MLLATSALACLAMPAAAHDHSNLDALRPLRVEDAYAVAEGEIVLEAGAEFVDERHGTDRWQAPLEVVWGAFRNAQLEIGTTLATDPHEVTGQEHPGDAHLAGLYNFNRETTDTPAFGVKVEANVPAVEDSTGVDLEVKGLMTKSFDRLSLHLNAGYRWLHGEDAGERDSGYEVVLGASHPLGAPMDTRTTLVADVYVEQAPKHGDDDIVGVEVGTRYQLTQRVVLDAGVGSEVEGPSERDDFRFTLGMSLSF
jgi:hypothetical protein